MQSGTERAPRRRGWISAPGMVVGLLCLLYFFAYVDRVNFGSAATMIRQEFSLSPMQVGLVFSAFGYPYILLQVFGGWFADRFGSRRVLTISVLITALATFGTSLAGGLASLFLCRLALGAGESVMFPAATGAVRAWVPRSRWALVQGLTHSSSRLGNALTPPIIAALIIWRGWRVSFVVMGIVTLLWAGLWLLHYRDDPATHPKIRPEDLARLQTRRSGGRQGTPWLRLAARMAPVTFTYFCYGWSAWVYLNWMPSFFLEGQGFDLATSALFASGVFLAGVVGDTAGGLLSDFVLRRTGRVGTARVAVIAGGMLGAAASLTAMLFLHDPVCISVALAIGFFFLELVIAPAWAVPMDIAPQFAATASGMMNIGFAVAGVVSPLVFGLAVQLSGSWMLPFAGSILLLVAGAACSFAMAPGRPFSVAAPDRTETGR